jgi:hypothetical protein
MRKWNNFSTISWLIFFNLVHNGDLIVRVEVVLEPSRRFRLPRADVSTD